MVARELRNLGFSDVHPDNGQVALATDWAGACRANLWLRSADRLWLKLARFPAASFEELFEGVRSLPWPELLPRNANFPVDGVSHQSQLSSVPACQSIVKKAVVESLKQSYQLDWFPEDGPRFPIRVSLVHDQATVSLDTSGTGLHKRGYRLLTGEAPLRETLAAALIQLSYWNAGRILLDPFCGSGTIPIEAAMIGLNRAPGLKREFACEAWPVVGRTTWAEARQEAEDRFDRTTRLTIYGSDRDGSSLRLARQNLKQAGLEDRGVFFETRPVSELRTRFRHGVLITNPPYGERLADQAEAERIYAEFGEVCRPLLDTWSVYVLSAHPGFARHFGHKETRRRKLYNGMIACQYYQYPGPPPPRSEGERPAHSH